MQRMNAVLETVLARRSVRFGYDRSRPVPEDVLALVVRCGLAAPSSKNAQPWRFHVVTSPALLDDIASAMEAEPGLAGYVPHDPRTGAPYEHWQSTVGESAAVLRLVPAAIVVENRGVFSGGRTTLRDAAPAALAGALEGYAFECVGIGAAIENMWIAALSLDLSVSFAGDVGVAEGAVAQLLGLEGDLVGVLSLGYSDAPALPPRLSPPSTQTDEPVRWIRDHRIS